MTPTYTDTWQEWYSVDRQSCPHAYPGTPGLEKSIILPNQASIVVPVYTHMKTWIVSFQP